LTIYGLCLVGLTGAAPPGSVSADVTGLRSTKGQILVCMTTHADRFSKCEADPTARRVTVPVAQAHSIRLEGLPSGNYAIALFHDENSNNKLDTSFGIPREGFGFSRNPVIRFGPPKFSEAQFAVGVGTVDQSVRIKYLL
jgi:uncharacterized protein (DUF2141 family)